MSIDPDTLAGVLDFSGAARNVVSSSVATSPQLRLDTAGASTLIVVCDDVDHEIPALAGGLMAAAASRTWELAAIKRAGGRTVLVFEDDVVRALRVADVLSVPAGSTTVNELATRLTSPRGVGVLLEPTRQTITRAFVLTSTVWAGLADLAGQTGRWRYSDGEELVLASPEWLLLQDPAATVVEKEGDYGQIDYDLHSNKALQSAAATHTGNPPTVGAVHVLDVPGPAAGPWLVAAYTTDLGVDSGRTTWLRPAAGAETSW